MAGLICMGSLGINIAIMGRDGMGLIPLPGWRLYPHISYWHAWSAVIEIEDGCRLGDLRLNLAYWLRRTL